MKETFVSKPNGRAADILKKDFPDLEIATCRFIGEGWNNRAYLVNNKVLFRLPSHRDSTDANRAKKVETEIALLNIMQERLNVAIPKPLYISPDHAYFGYTYLAGKNLERQRAKLSSPMFEQHFVQTFCRAAIKIETTVDRRSAETIGLLPYKYTQGLTDTAWAVENNLIPHWAQYLADQCLDEYVRLFDKAADRSIILHSDMGLHSWLVDGNDRISALIDWTDACIGPAEHQISAVVWEGNPRLVDQVVSLYERESGHKVDKRLVYLDFVLNVLGDLGYLIKEGGSPRDTNIQHLYRSLKTWTDSGLLQT